MGKLGAAAKAVWQFLDGWKTFILVPLLIAERYCAGHLCPGPFSYVGALVDGLGWRSVVPAVDPGEASMWLATGVALGHKLVKAWRQLRAGVPASALLSGQ